MIRRSLLVLALAASGCAFNPPVVPLDARSTDLARLTGRWAGSYHGGASGRSGSIEFTLAAGEDHAHGDVVLIARHAHQPYRPWRDAGPLAGEELTQILTIRFVAVQDGEISGELDPYRDPDCDCRAVTRFRGRLRGNVIEGTFVTTTARLPGSSRGTWKVRRHRR